MWNFSIPYKLKQLIDLTAQRNYLFTYDGKEYGPCLNIPKALVVYTRIWISRGFSNTTVVRSPSALH
jgi:FMN-dependent NADH-azoreductase